MEYNCIKTLPHLEFIIIIFLKSTPTLPQFYTPTFKLKKTLPPKKQTPIPTFRPKKRKRRKNKNKNPIPNLTQIPQTKAFLPEYLNQNQI